MKIDICIKNIPWKEVGDVVYEQKFKNFKMEK